MGKIGRFVGGVILNWVALATGLLMGFVLSPYVVHHLGNVYYGVWVLVVSLGSYMGLLDLGLRGAVTRFVSKHRVQNDHLSASRAVTAALWLRAGIGVLVITVGITLAAFVPRLFHIPPETYTAARYAIIITSVSMAAKLLFGVFAAVLVALHRFDLVSSTTIGQTAMRALGVVWLLAHGHGIVALALWELAAMVASNLVLTALCFSTYPELKLDANVPERALLGKFWTYSSYIIVINIFAELIYYSDNIVVGAFLSATAVTFYAIGGSLLESVRGVVMALTVTFTPLASTLEAEGRFDELRRLLIHGTQATLLVALPIEIALYWRGMTFIGLWMGPQYAPVSGRVLQVLLLAYFVGLGNYASASVAYGMEKHRPLAYWTAAEGISNLALSIILVRRIGLIGVAWGTTIPNLVIQLFLWPAYASRIVDIPLRQHLVQSWLRPAIASLPFAIACYVTDRYWHPTSLLLFFLQIAAILPVYLLPVVLILHKDLRSFTKERKAVATLDQVEA